MKGFKKINDVLTGLNQEPVYVTYGYLYETRVYYQCNNKFRLDAGGWFTNHTKKAINHCLPEGYRLFQKNFEWYLETPVGVKSFFSGMEVEITTGKSLNG